MHKTPDIKSPKTAQRASWLWRLVRRFAFARGYALIPVQEIEWLEASSLANHCAQKKHPQDSWDRGYFNGLADHASKTAYKLKRFYPPNVKDQPRAGTEK